MRISRSKEGELLKGEMSGKEAKVAGRFHEEPRNESV